MKGMQVVLVGMVDFRPSCKMFPAARIEPSTELNFATVPKCES